MLSYNRDDVIPVFRRGSVFIIISEIIVISGWVRMFVCVVPTQLQPCCATGERSASR